jgi:hypothetical protein
MLKSSKAESLRQTVVDDLQKGDFYGLYVVQEKKPGRAKGWAKIKCDKATGALNIEWYPDTKILIGRAVAKRGNYPDILVGSFVAYLIAHRGSSIGSIVIRTV